MYPSAYALQIAAIFAGLFLVGIIVWYYYFRRPRDREAPHRLGQEMGLQQLNEGNGKVPVWYGGRHEDHDFGLTYANLRYGSYGRKPALTVEQVVLSLRLAVALDVAEPQDIVAYFHHGRPYEPGETPEDFENAFDRRNTERLSQESRDAMLHFTQNYGSLRLRDRATAPKDLFVPEALPDAQVVLVHDRPGYKQTAEQVNALLDVLTDLARTLEQDPALNITEAD